MSKPQKRSRRTWLTVALWTFAILYVLLPTDLVPDTAPIVGWIDDLVVLLGTISGTIATVVAAMPKRNDDAESSGD